MLTTVQSTYDRTSVTSYADESITGPFPVFYTLNLIGNHKKTSVIRFTREALSQVADDIIRLAESESLTAHANSIQVRFKL